MIAGKSGGKTAWQKLTEKEPERADKDFPCGLRLFSRVSLDITDFLIAENYLTMVKPCEKGTIVEIGVIGYEKDGLKDYLASIAPDGATESDTMTLLYIETQDDKVLSSKLFTEKAKIFLTTEEERDVWLNETEGILRLTPLRDPNGIEFSRMWGEGDVVNPIEATETVLADRYGKTVKTNNLQMMLFARDVIEGEEILTTEFVLVSLVNDLSIEILNGIPITLTADSIVGA
jgi:hypothetical protein